MLVDDIILRPSAGNSVIRVLEQGKDGSILYSCEGAEPESEEIRLLHFANRKDILIYVNNSGCEIVNASLNPERNVIAFTTFKCKKPISKSQSKQDDTTVGSQTGQNWHFVSQTENDVGDKSELSQSPFSTENFCQPQKGQYASYLADIHPSTWIKMFDVNRRFYQRVTFTSYNLPRHEEGVLVDVMENRLLLIMHNKSIGLYIVTLRPHSGPHQRRHSGQGRRGSPPSKIELKTDSGSSLIVRKAFWSQWDPVRQRLYYIVLTKTRHESGDLSHVSYTQSLCCEQLVESPTQFHHRVFSCRFDLRLHEDLITRKSSEYCPIDMDPTVSSPHLNMRLLTLENGSLCLVWQNFTDDNVLYKVMVLDKDIVVHCAQRNMEMIGSSAPCQRLSFMAYGENILVCGAQSHTHLLATDCLSGDKDVFFQHCHYLSSDSDLCNLNLFCHLPFQMPTDTAETEQESTYGFVCDHITKVICKVRMDRKKVREHLLMNEKTLENKLAVARLGCIGFANSTGGSSGLKEILLSFLSKEMILNGDKLIGTFLVHQAANDVCTHCQEDARPFLRSLLPIAIHLPVEESSKYVLSVHNAGIIGDIKHQITGVGEKSWHSTKKAFECGQYASFDLYAINEELHVLRIDSIQKHIQKQKAALQDRLGKTFDKEILQPTGEISLDVEEENILDCFYARERDHMRENVMTLTFEKLHDHLKRYLSDHEAFVCKYIARNFVTAQLRSVNHMIALFIFVAGVEDHDRRLFVPAQPEERNLLQLVRIMLLSCVSANFPIPTGFQTFLTCLTFRCCLTTHISNEEMDLYMEDSDSNCSVTGFEVGIPFSYVTEDIDEFSFEFLQLVDNKCIQLTGEFVARLLEELPQHDVFEKFIHQVLLRANMLSSIHSEGLLQLWKHPKASSISAGMQMKNLVDKSRNNAKSSPSCTEDDALHTPASPPSGFVLLDTFCEFVEEKGKMAQVDVDSVYKATMESFAREHGKENLKHIAY